MNISLNRKHMLGIVCAAVLIAVVAFLLPKAFVHGDVPPSEVKDMSLSVDGTSITATWGEPDQKGDGTYLSYVFDLNNMDSGEKYADKTSKTTYTFSDLTEGRYTFSVSVENDFGSSMPVSGETTISLAPQAPTGFTYSSASAEAGLIELSWSAPDIAVENYRIYVTDPNRESTEYTVAGDTYSWTSSSLADGVYNVSLVAENNKGSSTSLPTETLDITLGSSSGGGGGVAQVGPQNLTYDSVLAAAGQLSLDWDDDKTKNVTGYNVIAVQNKEINMLGSLAPNVTSYTTSLADGTYNITVYAVYVNGENVSSSLDGVVITSSSGGPTEALSGPIKLAYDILSARTNVLSLSWERIVSDKLKDYLLEIFKGKDTVYSGTLRSDSTSYSGSLDSGTYGVKVTANYSTGSASSSLSDVVIGSGGDGGATGEGTVAPQNLAYDEKEATVNTLLLTWDADTTGSVAGYDVVISQNKEQIVNDSVESDVNQYKVALEPGDYDVLVTAVYKDKTTASSSLETVTLGESKGGDTKISIVKSGVSLFDDASYAQIVWTTDVLSDSLVEFGPGKLFIDSKQYISDLVKDHNIRINKLFPCTVYNYRMSSSDGKNSVESDTNYFITRGCAKDSQVSQYSTKEVKSTRADTLSLVNLDTSKEVGTIEITKPVAKDAESVVFQMKQLDLVSGSDFEKDNRKLANGEVFDIKAFSGAETKVETFDNPVQVTLNFIPSELAKNIDTSTLAIWHSDDNGSTWTKLPNCNATIDSKNDTGQITCDTSEFSLFAIFGDVSKDNGGGDTPPDETPAGATHSSSVTGVKNKTDNLVPVNSTGLPKFSFTKDLYLGTVNPDVKILQKTLNSLGFFVSTYGAGSVGSETNYYGEKTKQAVARFQEAHSAEILTPYGFKKGTGRVGPYTRVLLNTLLSK